MLRRRGRLEFGGMRWGLALLVLVPVLSGALCGPLDENERVSIPPDEPVEPEGFSIQSETSVVESFDREQRTLVVAYNDVTDVRIDGEVLEGHSFAGLAVSTDLGASWDQAVLRVPDDEERVGIVWGDPWLARGELIGDVAGASQRIYYAAVATRTGNPVQRAVSQLVIWRSDNGGQTFPDFQLAFDVGTNDPCTAVDHATIDVRQRRRIATAFHGNRENTIICTSRADRFDGVWAPPTPLPFACSAAPGNRRHGIVRFDPLDEDVVWLTTQEPEADGDYRICLWRSEDAGSTWALHDVVAADLRARTSHALDDGTTMRIPFRSWFDLDRDDGRLVVAYTNTGNIGGGVFDHVFVAVSEDGLAWEVREVSPSGLGHQFQPALALGDRRWGASWYDTRNDDPDHVLLDLFGASRGAAAILPGWGVSRLTEDREDGEVPFEPCPTLAPGNYFGDYIGLTPLRDAPIQRFFTAWADARLGCEERDGLANTFHQHVEGVVWR